MSKDTESQAFFYIDGIPTKGLWIDLDEVNGWEDVEEKLLDLFPSAQIDEILCSDIEGIGLHFYASNCDSFDMDAWIEFKEDFKGSYLDIEVMDAYFKNCGVSSVENVEDAYQGEYKDWTDFAYELLEQTGDLQELPENLRYYFDYEKFGRDLSYDYFESEGYFFRNL
jgi:antirestriction protein